MRTGKPSGTAISSAACRAAHLYLYDGPTIHEDGFALRLIGANDPEALHAAFSRLSMPALPRISAYFALRHRFSEERLRAALDRGVTQVVLLGAGLDSFALRNPEVPANVLYVEVDHPDTQRWKLEQLASLDLKTPAVVYVPVDFACQDLAAELSSAGVGPEMPTFFAWLGVTQYISEQATYQMLEFVGRHSQGSEIVFDVIRPMAGLPSDELAISEAARASAEESGEPWLSYFVPEQLNDWLVSAGFSRVDRLTPDAAATYYAGQPSEVRPLSAWELIAAIV